MHSRAPALEQKASAAAQSTSPLQPPSPRSLSPHTFELPYEAALFHPRSAQLEVPTLLGVMVGAGTGEAVGVEIGPVVGAGIGAGVGVIGIIVGAGIGPGVGAWIGAGVGVIGIIVGAE